VRLHTSDREKNVQETTINLLRVEMLIPSVETVKGRSEIVVWVDKPTSADATSASVEVRMFWDSWLQEEKNGVVSTTD